MSETEMNYMAKFSLDTSDLTKGITGAAISFDAIMLAAREAFAIMKEGYDQTIGKAVEFGEAIDELSDITGDSKENIQRLRAAAVATGSDFDSAGVAMRLFSVRLGDAGSAGVELRQRLEDIGVSFTDVNGQMRSASDLFMEVNAKAGEMGDITQRNNLLNAAYGRSWVSIVDMITKADVATTAYKNLDPISDADIAKAEEFGVKLGVISDKINMIGVNIGMYALGDGGTGVNVQNLVSGSSARDFWGGVYNWATGATAAADAEGATDPNQSLKAQTAVIAPLIDTFAGMTNEQLKYAEAADNVQAAQVLLNKEMGQGTQSSVDAASRALQRAKNDYEALRKEMAATAAQATTTNLAIQSGSKGVMFNPVTGAPADDAQLAYNQIAGTQTMGNMIPSANYNPLEPVRTPVFNTNTEYASMISRAAAGKFQGPQWDYLNDLVKKYTTIDGAGNMQQSWQNLGKGTPQDIKDAYNKFSVTVVNNNMGSASPFEIQEATTKAVSEALGRQVTS